MFIIAFNYLSFDILTQKYRIIIIKSSTIWTECISLNESSLIFIYICFFYGKQFYDESLNTVDGFFFSSFICTIYIYIYSNQKNSMQIVKFITDKMCKKSMQFLIHRNYNFQKIFYQLVCLVGRSAHSFALNKLVSQKLVTFVAKLGA